MSKSYLCLTFCIMSFSLGSARLQADEVDGFAQPYRTIDLSAVETGIIAKIHVHEGETVKAGQVLVQLDTELLDTSLEIARQAKDAQGRQKSAQSELELRMKRLEKLKSLFDRGHAHTEEVSRAEADVEIARANLLSIHEDLIIRELEFKRIQTQIKRHQIVSPINGVVLQKHKNEAELVAPLDPRLITIVQLDPLIASFSIPNYQATRISKGETLKVLFLDVNQQADGEVDFVSPVIDAESGTVRVEVLVSNSAGKFRGGARCTLILAVDTAARQ